MKVKILSMVSNSSYSYRKGDIVEIDDSLGNVLISLGVAKEILASINRDEIEEARGTFPTLKARLESLGGGGAVDAYTKAQSDAKYATITTVNGKANTGVSYTKAESDGKYALTTALTAKANTADVYTKTEADTKLATKANVADVYTKTEADGKYAASALTARVTTAEGKITAVEGVNTTQNTNITNLTTKLSAAEATIVALTERIVALETAGTP